jgi:hypothetical protein
MLGSVTEFSGVRIFFLAPNFPVPHPPFPAASNPVIYTHGYPQLPLLPTPTEP